MTCAGLSLEPIFLQVADYFAPGPAPVYVVSPMFHVSFSSILYGYVYTHTHTHNFSRFLQHHPVRICVYTPQSLFHSFSDWQYLEYLVSSSSKLASVVNVLVDPLPNFP